jgi:hypothetical protein
LGRAAELRRSLRQAALLLAAVAVIGLVAGWFFARGDAASAARLLLGDEVVEEPAAHQAPGPGPDPARPTSGPQRTGATCGVQEVPASPETQVATLAAGIVILHHRDDLDPSTHAVLTELASEHERVLVVPAEDLDAEVVATAWRHRLDSDEVDGARLERFVVGWGERGPDPAPCPDRVDSG